MHETLSDSNQKYHLLLVIKDHTMIFKFFLLILNTLTTQLLIEQAHLAQVCHHYLLLSSIYLKTLFQNLLILFIRFPLAYIIAQIIHQILFISIFSLQNFKILIVLNLLNNLS